MGANGERFGAGFGGFVAVVTGAGTGMGRELVRQLAADGCDVAFCDIDPDNLAETERRCADDNVSGEVLGIVCDVADEAQVLAMRDAVAQWRPHVNLLFNNAGISGGGSFVAATRDEWDATFGVDWGGVYLCTRAFLPALLRAEIGQVVNTSSVNGFWANLGGMPHTAYSAAKFAVKGFTEALITDFRVNAPHLRATLVMPGWIGTSIATNSLKRFGALNAATEAIGEGFRTGAPVTAAQAATVILDGVRNDDWRILIGDDAVALDAAVRADPAVTFAGAPVPFGPGADGAASSPA